MNSAASKLTWLRNNSTPTKILTAAALVLLAGGLAISIAPSLGAAYLIGTIALGTAASLGIASISGGIGTGIGELYNWTTGLYKHPAKSRDADRVAGNYRVLGVTAGLAMGAFFTVDICNKWQVWQKCFDPNAATPLIAPDAPPQIKADPVKGAFLHNMRQRQL